MIARGICNSILKALDKCILIRQFIYFLFILPPLSVFVKTDYSCVAEENVNGLY
jgi:hypothetical protein